MQKHTQILYVIFLFKTSFDTLALKKNTMSGFLVCLQIVYNMCNWTNQAVFTDKSKYLLSY